MTLDAFPGLAGRFVRLRMALLNRRGQHLQCLENWENSQMADITKGRFGFHRGGGKHEPVPAAPYVQIYVKTSVLSRAPDSAISAHLMTEAEIDEFVDDALAEFEEIRIDAKKALAAA